MGHERLRPADASLLHLESSRAPMHVGALALFEGAPFLGPDGRFRLDDVRAHVATRLHLAPMYRQRLRAVPLGQGRPVWVDDERFDLSYHVRLTALPRPGDEDQLLALVGRLQSQPLDRQRPLWELWFVEGLTGDRVAAVLKVHQVLADPAGGPDLMAALLDPGPGTPSPIDPADWVASPGPNAVRLLAGSLVQRATQPAEVARTVRAALRGPRRVAAHALATTRVLGRLRRAATRLPFNGSIGPHRRVAVVHVPLARAERVRELTGAPLIDVVLAAVTGALRTYLDAGGHTLDVTVRALAPTDEPGATSRVLDLRRARAVVELPVGELDPAARLAALRSRRDGDGAAAGADDLLAVAGLGPPALLAAAARLLPRQRAVNVAVASADGPQVPVHLFGARMIEAVPYVGPVDGLALVFTALAYGETLSFGLCADRDAVPDLDVVAAGLTSAFDDLERATAAAGRS